MSIYVDNFNCMITSFNAQQSSILDPVAAVSDQQHDIRAILHLLSFKYQ